MSAQEISSQADFREGARTNDVPIPRLIGFVLYEVFTRKRAFGFRWSQRHAPCDKIQARAGERAHSDPEPISSQDRLSAAVPAFAEPDIRSLSRAKKAVTED